MDSSFTIRRTMVGNGCFARNLNINADLSNTYMQLQDFETTLKRFHRKPSTVRAQNPKTIFVSLSTVYRSLVESSDASLMSWQLHWKLLIPICRLFDRLLRHHFGALCACVQNSLLILFLHVAAAGYGMEARFR